MTRHEHWSRYKTGLCVCRDIGLTLDVSRMNVSDPFFEQMAESMGDALHAMNALEHGAIANADEQRMVGHYWLRAPLLAPSEELTLPIQRTIDRVKQFAFDVHTGVVDPPTGDGFYVTLLIGIGGSVLGPEFVCDALSRDNDPMIFRVIDNTDPDGIDRILGDIGGLLSQTLTVVVSKSGQTTETWNAMLEVAAAYERAGLDFAKRAVAVTQEDSRLDRLAVEQQWLSRFPIWDWVGGRTSVTSAVGLLPAALQGIDVDAFLAGAREADVCTREPGIMKNPAALLALMWYHAACQQDLHNMVLLPYRDRLALLGKYLQQLVMESLGKRLNRAGAVVHQGLTVFGNKGTSDQHSFGQQLIEGPDDCFVTFVEVMQDRDQQADDVFAIEEGVTSGDFLHAFLHTTRDELTAAGRRSMTITLDRFDARRLGSLIALFERAVGLYAELIDVNAYHQPGVDAGKNAAADIIRLQRTAVAFLKEHATDVGTSDSASPEPSPNGFTAEDVAADIGEPERAEAVFHILSYLSANPGRGIISVDDRSSPNARFALEPGS